MNNKLNQNQLFRHLQIVIVILISFFAYLPITKSDIGTPSPINKLILASAIKPRKQSDIGKELSFLPSNSIHDYLFKLRQLATGE